VDLAPAESYRAAGIDAARLQDTLKAVLTRGLRDRAYPGAVAIVGNRYGVVARAAVGVVDTAPGAPAVDEGTMWDLASLTKVIALTTSVMQLVHAGKIDLDAPVQHYLPEFSGTGKEKVRVRDLLTHSSGLPSWRPLYKETSTRADALRLVLSTPLEAPTGTRMVYSDLGAILLGLIVERRSGVPLDRFVQAQLLDPLGMHHSMYRPPQGMLGHIAPTEVDPWRQRHLRGEVHDENAARLDGVSGHAGLFASAADLSRFARMLLNHGRVGDRVVIDSATLRHFTQVQNRELSHRALGWETANGANSGGQRMSARAFGHTGFTGTSIWIDPERDVYVLLLTNRVNPTRENRRIGDVRVALANRVMEQWTQGPPGSR
jgi:CubicO group peptidase (beta-lactamase class C family)